MTPQKRKEIQAIVEEMLRKYRGYGDAFALLQKVAAENAIEILEADLYDISGALRREGEQWRIYINRLDSPTRQLFTFAHELGHFFLHRDGGREFVDGDFVMNRDEGTTVTSEEMEANEFAGNLIMSKARIEQKLQGNAPSEKQVLELADCFHVSPLAMVIRLRSLGYAVPETASAQR